MKKNLLDDIPGSIPEELTEVLLARKGFRVERIVSRGHSSPEGFWYDQAEGEWVLLLAGSAVLEYEGGERVELGPGDSLNIPARVRHRVHSTAPDRETVWLAVFYT